MVGVVVHEVLVNLQSGIAEPPLAQRTDDELMLASRTDRAAFEVLLRRHWDALARYVARRVGDADAPDLCQDVLITLWNLRERYEPQGRFPSWLFAIARRRVMRHMRWARVRRVFAARDHVDETPPPPSALDGAIHREELHRLRHKIAALPVEMQDLLALRCGAGLDYAVIAELLGIPEGTLRSRVSRCLVTLGAQLSEPR